MPGISSAAGWYGGYHYGPSVKMREMIGANDNGYPLSYTSTQNTQSFNKLAQWGTWVCASAPWLTIEPSDQTGNRPAGYSWVSVDNWIVPALDAGHEVVMTLGVNVPSWARTGDIPAAPGAPGGPLDGDANPPTQAEIVAWENYCYYTASRYLQMGVNYYQIWRGPNVAACWIQGPNVDTYAQLLYLAYQQIKQASVDTGIPAYVLTGSTLPTSPPTNWVGTQNYVIGDQVTLGSTNYICIAPNLNNRPPNDVYWFLGGNYTPADFLNALYASLDLNHAGARPFDYVSHAPYPTSAEPAVVLKTGGQYSGAIDFDGLPYLNNFWGETPLIRQAIINHESSARARTVKIFGTEAGAASFSQLAQDNIPYPLSEAQQATVNMEMLEIWFGDFKAFTGPFMFYQLRDLQTGVAGVSNNSGIYKDFSFYQGPASTNDEKFIVSQLTQEANKQHVANANVMKSAVMVSNATVIPGSISVVATTNPATVITAGGVSVVNAVVPRQTTFNTTSYWTAQGANAIVGAPYYQSKAMLPTKGANWGLNSNPIDGQTLNDIMVAAGAIKKIHLRFTWGADSPIGSDNPDNLIPLDPSWLLTDTSPVRSIPLLTTEGSNVTKRVALPWDANSRTQYNTAMNAIVSYLTTSGRINTVGFVSASQPQLFKEIMAAAYETPAVFNNPTTLMSSIVPSQGLKDGQPIVIANTTGWPTGQHLVRIRSTPYNQVGVVHPWLIDFFEGRTLTNGWGITDFGLAWVASGNSSAAVAVDGVLRWGTIITPVNDYKQMTALRPTATQPTPNIIDSDIFMCFLNNVGTPTGATHSASVVTRWKDANNHYRFRVNHHTDDSVHLDVQKMVAGVPTTVTDNAVPAISGITIDEVSDLAATVSGLTALPVRPTTRVVFDVTSNTVPNPTSYTTALTTLGPVTDIMGLLVDSDDMAGISRAQYTTRANSYLSTLGSLVDIWEIGNEVNGNWTGAYSIVAGKIDDAFGIFNGAGKKTALTLYYNPNNVDGAGELTPLSFTDAWVSPRMKEGLDYVLLSYYEEDFANYRPTVGVLTTLFQQLHIKYPGAKLGFGEIGRDNAIDSGTLSTGEGIMSYYYGLNIPLDYYIGGYFWWYGKQDVLSSGSLMTTDFTAAVNSQPSAGAAAPLADVVLPGLTINTDYYLRARTQNSGPNVQLSMKIWKTTDVEPAWQVLGYDLASSTLGGVAPYQDSDNLTQGAVGIQVSSGAGYTSNAQWMFKQFQVGEICVPGTRDTEYVLIASRSGPNLTVGLNGRGFSGTHLCDHVTGDSIEWVSATDVNVLPTTYMGRVGLWEKAQVNMSAWHAVSSWTGTDTFLNRETWRRQQTLTAWQTHLTDLIAMWPSNVKIIFLTDVLFNDSRASETSMVTWIKDVTVPNRISRIVLAASNYSYPFDGSNVVAYNNMKAIVTAGGQVGLESVDPTLWPDANVMHGIEKSIATVAAGGYGWGSHVAFVSIDAARFADSVVEASNYLGFVTPGSTSFTLANYLLNGVGTNQSVQNRMQ